MNVVFRNKLVFFVALGLILALAFFLRLNFNSSDLIDSDSFYHARMVQYILENNSLPETDPLAYYQIQEGTPIVEAGLLWGITAGLYKLVYFEEGFDSQKLYSLLKVFPIIFGLIAILFICFISSSLFGEKIGLAAAFVGAILPSLIYRTSAGFFEDENIGIVLMLLSFFVYFKILNEKNLKTKLIYSLLVGVTLALMSLTWKVYLLIPLVLLAQTCVGQILISIKSRKANEARKEFFVYTVTSFLMILATSLGIFALGQNLFKDISFYLMLGGINITQTEVFLFFIFSLVSSTLIGLALINIKNQLKEIILSLFPFLFYLLWVILGAGLYFILNKSFVSINMFIYEELPGTLFFFEQNGLLLILVGLSLAILPFIIRFEPKIYLDKLFLFMLLTASFFMAAYQVKHMFLFGAIAPLGVAFLLSIILKMDNKKIKLKLFEKKFYLSKINLKNLVLVAFLLILLFSAFSSFGVIKNIESVTQKIFGVKEASIWLNTNSPSESSVFSWWDAGHLITFFAERKVVCDNRNYFGQLSELNKNVAEFFITSDINRGLKIIRGYDSDYLLIYPQLFTQTRVLNAYFKNPKSALNSGLSSNYYGFCDRVDSNIICDGKVLVDLRDNNSDYWTDKSNASIGGEEYYFYLGEDFYFLIDVNTNKSNLAKIFFESAETKNYYEKVYSWKGTRIFKVLR